MGINKKLFTGDAGGIVAAENFGIVAWTGAGNAASSTISLGFAADLAITKDRQQAGIGMFLFDSIRGAGERLKTYDTTAEQSAPTGTISVTSFDSTSLEIRDDIANPNIVYAWKAGGSSNTFNKNGTGYSSASAAGLTAGTTAPSGSSVNTDTGISIIKVTTDSGSNKTIPHGLGVKPELIIWKRLDSAEDGWTYTDLIDGSYDYLILNSNAQKVDDATAAPTTSVVSAPTTGVKTYAAYMFASIPGFSKIGKYTGNGSSNGPTVDCGFQPNFLMIKTTSTGHWMVYDSKRDTTNAPETDTCLFMNLDSAEFSASDINIRFNNNGFTLKGNNSNINSSSTTYIYYAIA